MGARPRTLIAAVGFVISLGLNANGQAAFAEDDQLLQRAAADGQRYLDAKDSAARKSAKSSLDLAEQVLKNLSKQDPACEGCLERQVGVAYYRAYIGFSGDFDDTIEAADRALARYPRNSSVLYFSALAHYNRKEFDLATSQFSRFLAVAGPGSSAAGQVKTLLDDSRKQFLTSWYKQSNFYQSAEGRIERYNPKTARNEVVFQYTPEWELGLGGQALTALTTAAPTVQSPELSAYLTTLVMRLTDKTPGPPFKYQVRVLDSPQINAVTPPGHIIVYSGLLRFVENEAQLAAVLSHELAHNYAHHSARRVTKAYQAKAITSALTSAINPQSVTAQAMLQLSAGLGTDLFLKAYSRFEEKEADLYGSHILFNAGYNATEMPALFARLYELNPRQPVKLFSTHPPAPDRVEYLADYLEGFPLDRESRLSTEEFAKIKAMFPSPTSATGPGTGRGVAPVQPNAAPAMPQQPVTTPAAPVTAPTAAAPAAVAPASPAAAPAGVPPAPVTKPADTIVAAAPPPIASDISGASGGLPPAPSRQPASACKGFAGVWDTDRGLTSIVADGVNLRGTFDAGGFVARVSNTTAEGRWATPPTDTAPASAGTLALVLQPDGSWKGHWSRDTDAPGEARPWTGRCAKR
jgi:predicted Zn-dependent protease